uniref:Uncharacterized protein n=1 Tax=Polynucleobacter necessarius subsp. necessarius (strain STIR1) TaxID=452638 RepID=B1XUQ8_POLNS
MTLNFLHDAVLAIAGTFHWIDHKLENKRIYGANFFSYFVAILLIIGVHFVEIIAWAYYGNYMLSEH